MNCKRKEAVSYGRGGRRVAAPPPGSWVRARQDGGEVAERVRDRAIRWLPRRGYLDERTADDRRNEPAAPAAIEACTKLALAGMPAGTVSPRLALRRLELEVDLLHGRGAGGGAGEHPHPAGACR